MNPYDFDEWYYQALDRAVRTPKRRGHLARLKAQWPSTSVYKKRTSLYAPLGRGSARSLWFAGAKPRALHRTRTGDPFLTMHRSSTRLRRGIALVLGLFWLSVGLLILTLLGGLDA